MNYSIGSASGPGKPKKVKRTGPKPAGRKEGEVSREARMKKFDNPTDRKKVAKEVSINTQSKKMIDEGLELNEYGAPKGDQKHKKFKTLFKGLNPKFRKSK